MLASPPPPQLILTFHLLAVLDFPKRPPWNYQMTKEQLLVREEKCFREYLENIYSAFQPSQLSYFEHNLEVSPRKGFGENMGFVH